MAATSTRYTWKPIEAKHKPYPCRGCRNDETVEYRVVEDSDCHEDYNYRCTACGKNWWVDGIDY